MSDPIRETLEPPAPAPAADGEHEELAQWLERIGDDYDDLYRSPSALIRPKLTRAAALLREARPQPVPVADGEREEREELAAWVEFEADNAQELGCATIYDHDRLRWVAGYLRQPAPAPMPVPVAVSQRLPEPRDCDADGRCWVGCAAQIDQTGDFDAEYNASWELCPVHPQDEVWLPHWAIPQPPQGGEVES